MAEKKLYDNLYKVIKGNSGPFTANDGILTEIFDLQIPRGYAARIREVVFTDLLNVDQLDQSNLQFFVFKILLCSLNCDSNRNNKYYRPYGCFCIYAKKQFP